MTELFQIYYENHYLIQNHVTFHVKLQEIQLLLFTVTIRETGQKLKDTALCEYQHYE